MTIEDSHLSVVGADDDEMEQVTEAGETGLPPLEMPERVPGEKAQPEKTEVDGNLFKWATDIALKIPKSTTFPAWQEVVSQLAAIDRGSPWWLGDALNFGEDKFGEKMWAGIEVDDFNPETIAKRRSLSRQYEPEDRFIELTLTHHRDAVGLVYKVRQEALQHARDVGMLSGAFREYVAELKKQDENTTEASRDRTREKTHAVVAVYMTVLAEDEEKAKDVARSLEDQATELLSKANVMPTSVTTNVTYKTVDVDG